MRDYRVLSMDYIGGPVTIHNVALDLDDVPGLKDNFGLLMQLKKMVNFIYIFQLRIKMIYLELV